MCTNFVTFWRNEAMDGEKAEVAETGETWSTDGLMDGKPLHGIVSRGNTRGICLNVCPAQWVG